MLFRSRDRGGGWRKADIYIRREREKGRERDRDRGEDIEGERGSDGVTLYTDGEKQVNSTTTTPPSVGGAGWLRGEVTDWCGLIGYWGWTGYYRGMI